LLRKRGKIRGMHGLIKHAPGLSQRRPGERSIWLRRKAARTAVPTPLKKEVMGVVSQEQKVRKKPCATQRRWRSIWCLPFRGSFVQLSLSGFSGEPAEARGMLSAELTVGSKTLLTAFFVVEVRGRYNILLRGD
jgi:hypothetical protein